MDVFWRGGQPPATGKKRLLFTTTIAGDRPPRYGPWTILGAGDRPPRYDEKNVSLYDNDRGGQAPALRATDDSRHYGPRTIFSASLKHLQDLCQLLACHFGRRKGLRNDKLLIHSEIL